MTEVKKQSVQVARTTILHSIVSYLSDAVLEDALDSAENLLEFLQGIEDKTADDLRKVKEQKKFIERLSGQAYRSRLELVYTEALDKMADEHLVRYYQDLLYEAALRELDLNLAVPLQELNEDIVEGEIEKPTLQ